MSQLAKKARVRPTVLYRHVFDGKRWRTHRHRVLKWGRRWVHVETDPRPLPAWAKRSGKTKIERAELEREGRARGSIGHQWFEFSESARAPSGDPMMHVSRDFRAALSDAVPDCLRRLGLGAGSTAEAVKRAYRERARRDHPDRGGSAQLFQRLQEDYRAALEVVGGEV